MMSARNLKKKQRGGVSTSSSQHAREPLTTTTIIASSSSSSSPNGTTSSAVVRHRSPNLPMKDGIDVDGSLGSFFRGRQLNSTFADDHGRRKPGLHRRLAKALHRIDLLSKGDGLEGWRHSERGKFANDGMELRETLHTRSSKPELLISDDKESISRR
ncbi:hypothetical protein SCHPADRAFT_941479 [Schizopora paradoxa]|uniref:Uncharacterized protein n=1 Tax=Schizopora paradoxa TaxID=27342 RepID=A0A0H2RJV1_9AGAM|nr:hypothetical protein SCHPADRAFT_941479 [Schizopora paradoxa]